MIHFEGIISVDSWLTLTVEIGQGGQTGNSGRIQIAGSGARSVASGKT